MFCLTLVAEDSIILVHRENDKWIGKIGDNPTGKNEVVEWTDAQLAAVLALCVGGENEELESISARLYELAEPAVANLSIECRPIP